MATRKPWASLSEGYRERLARKGITEASHSSGASLKKARGHENTPEHPSEAITKPREYPDYMRERSRLMSQVRARKYRLWGESHKFNDRRANRVINGGFDGKHSPSNAMLKWAIAATEDELLEAMTSGDEDYSFLWYH
jgi:hypothetical protein